MKPPQPRNVRYIKPTSATLQATDPKLEAWAKVELEALLATQESNQQESNRRMVLSYMIQDMRAFLREDRQYATRFVKRRQAIRRTLDKIAPIHVGAPVYSWTAENTLDLVGYVESHVVRRSCLRSVEVRWIDQWGHDMPIYFGTVEGSADNAAELLADDMWVSKHECVGFRLTRRRRLILRSGGPNFPR